MKLFQFLSSFFFIFLLFIYTAQGQADRKQLLSKAQKIDADLVKALKTNNFREAVRLAKQNGEIYASLNKASIAERYYKNAITYATKANDNRLLGYAYEMEGDFLSPTTAYKKKISNYTTAEKLYREVNSIEGIASVKKKIAKNAFEQKKYETASQHSKALIDSANIFNLNEFEKLSHCKALIISLSKLNNSQELKKYIDVLSGINMYAVRIVSKQQDSLEATSNELALKREESEIQQNLLRKQDSLAKMQKRIIAQQEELVKLQASKNQQLVIGIILSLIVIAIAVIALIGRQIANRKLAKQKAEIEAQKKLIETERKKSEELLLNILPYEIANELKEKGLARPRSYNMVTVLFTDFKGFTTISEKLSPEQIVDKLNFFFQKFDEIAEKHRLEKIKTIGDGYMCAGGIPIENTTNPVDAVRAGLEMQAFMNEWNRAQESKGLPTFGLRVGINTGPLVAGVIGKNKFAYDVWGDTVNLASRMESSGEVGKVNISGITYTWVKHYFECTYRGKIEAKNKGEVDMYFVEREKA